MPVLGFSEVRARRLRKNERVKKSELNVEKRWHEGGAVEEGNE